MEHAWCRDVRRDNAVRAAEDGRSVLLPTLEECIADAKAMMPKSVSAASGLRTERITLDVTHRCTNVPAAEWVLEIVRDYCEIGESVRVVEEPAP